MYVFKYDIRLSSTTFVEVRSTLKHHIHVCLSTANVKGRRTLKYDVHWSTKYVEIRHTLNIRHTLKYCVRWSTTYFWSKKYVEMRHKDFLGVRFSANYCVALKECNLPLCIDQHIKFIKYWTKLFCMSEH